MSKWKQIKIGEVGKTITGKTPSSEFPEDYGNEVMFITPSDSFDLKIIHSTNRYLSKNGKGKLLNKLLPPKSILVSCIGSAMGKVIMNFSEAVTNQQINSIIVNSNYNSDYIYYCLKNNYKLLRNASSGSTALPMLNKTDFDELVLRLHFELPTQQRIAHILSTLDAKIELNNRINAQLEAMAKTIYDYWFVQFDFPFDYAQGKADENGKPYKSSGGKMVWNEELKRDVPEGWEVGTLSDIADIIGGSTPPREVESNFCKNGMAWITPKDLSNNTGNKYITKGELDVTELGIKSASLNIMPKGSVLLSSRAPIGYLAIARQKVTTNQGFKSFIPKAFFTTEYIYYTIKNLIPTIESNASGSTFKEVSATTLKAMKIILPKKFIIENYSEKVISIFKKQDNLEQQNQHLSSLRDWLLPMLMNGQVSVSER